MLCSNLELNRTWFAAKTLTMRNRQSATSPAKDPAAMLNEVAKFTRETKREAKSIPKTAGADVGRKRERNIGWRREHDIEVRRKDRQVRRGSDAHTGVGRRVG